MTIKPISPASGLTPEQEGSSNAAPVGLSRHEYYKRLSEEARQAALPAEIAPEEPALELEGPAEGSQQPGSADEVYEELPAEQVQPRRSMLESLRLPKLKFAPAFWTFTGVLSLTINIILIVVVISLASQVFNLKTTLQDQLIGGLYNNFQLMDQAHIKTTIPVSAMVPAKFNLPVDTETTVILKKDTPIKKARVTLTTGGMTITNAPADIILPAGTELPIKLSIVVPVDQQIPVNLTVSVDIPLKDTELHQPFTGLQAVVGPYYSLLKSAPSTLEDAVCGKNASDFCKWLIP